MHWHNQIQFCLSVFNRPYCTGWRMIWVKHREQSMPLPVSPRSTFPNPLKPLTHPDCGSADAWTYWKRDELKYLSINLVKIGISAGVWLQNRILILFITVMPNFRITTGSPMFCVFWVVMVTYSNITVGYILSCTDLKVYVSSSDTPFGHLCILAEWNNEFSLMFFNLN